MNSMVLQGDVLSALMIGNVLVLAQVLSEWDAFGADGVGVFPFILYRASPR